MRTTVERKQEALIKLNESPDFLIFLQMLEERSAAAAKGLHVTCSDQLQVAHHNYLVGFLEGLRLAHDTVSAALASS